MTGDFDARVEEKIEEYSGKLKSQEEEKLMHTVVESDKNEVDGKLIADAVNRGVGSFDPELMFEQMVKNYSVANSIYGETIIRLLSGYDPNYLKRNIQIPEFRKELRERLFQNIENLKERNVIDKDGFISEKGVKLASMVLCTSELDRLVSIGLIGENPKKDVYGDKGEIRKYAKGDRYRDIALKSSVKISIRRGKDNLGVDELRSFERKSRGEICLIYAIDASGSMKGKKIESCKKAGIALAYKAIDSKDKVGLLVFGSDIKEEVRPTKDFSELLDKITRIRASRETDIAMTIKKSLELFPQGNVTKHLILLSDAMPTVGKKPAKETIEAAGLARNMGITVSFIGVGLNEEGKKLAQEIVEISNGKFYMVRNLEDVDKVVLEDYFAIA
ncbi:MAG TPA: VWA domain-containing protein [Candidatus Nanoarchaeia archaeon]|nr:VWA domain-containing protein [Candidatus Nanoarchaeia archaeon]